MDAYRTIGRDAMLFECNFRVEKSGDKYSMVGRGKINLFAEERERQELYCLYYDLGHFRQSSNLTSIDLNRLETASADSSVVSVKLRSTTILSVRERATNGTTKDGRR